MIAKIAIAGAAFWAYREGHLDGIIDRGRGWLSGDVPGDPRPQGGYVGSLFDEHRGPSSVWPEIQPDNPPLSYQGAMSDEEVLLRQNWDDVQPWARANVEWVAAMMRQESNGNTAAISSAGARGLLQVMPTTMTDIHDRLGYRKYAPNPMSLHLPNVGIYYGTAYMQHLADDYSQGSDIEWLTRAYNAGPGGRRSSGFWPLETREYLSKIKGYYAENMAQKGN